MQTLTEALYATTPRSEGSVDVGAFTVLEASHEAPILIGEGVRIGHHALVAGDVHLADRVHVDDYCFIGAGSRIGTGSQVLYGGRVFEEVSIGERCIVAGSVANWSAIGNDVTFMGMIAHSYRKPQALSRWNTSPVPSPVIEDGAIIGEAALLIGGVKIGRGAYVAAGEVVRCDVPPRMLLMGGRLKPLEAFQGFITARV